MESVRIFGAFVLRDLRLELRSRDAFNAMLFYALLIIVIFSFAFEAGMDLPTRSRANVAGGLLWVAFLFAGIISLDRAFLREQPESCLTGIKMSPASRSAAISGKFASSFILMLLVEAVLLPLFAVLFNTPATAHWGWIGLTVVLGTWALAATGTYFSAVSTHTRSRTLLLPLLLLPVSIPAIIATVQATQVLLLGQGVANYWLKILVGYDIVFTALGLLLADVVFDVE
jgi:heme exporter protein B